MYYFASDFHLGHGKTIEYFKRPFKDVTEMDETIIKNVNDIVNEDDTLFFLGDFCMKRSSEASDAPQNAFDYYRNQIKCKNIIFINGNHDENNGTKTIIESLVIDFGGHKIHLTHNPKKADENFKFNFCGHTHGNEGTFNKLGKKSVIVDLSVDCWEFQPVDINSINQAHAFWLKNGKKNEKTN